MTSHETSPGLTFTGYHEPPDEYEGPCSVCGVRGRFCRDRLGILESFRCGSCGASLRYQGQARTIVRTFSRCGVRSLSEFVNEPEFSSLSIFEPGTRGPLRRYLRRARHYVRSEYDPSARPGEMRDGVRNEDLMQLSFDAESFDLVVTSDIFEHVRHPYRAFDEVYRVLRAGGMHIFTVPCRWPPPRWTEPRVAVAGPDDVLIDKPVYHGDSLVYNDFGLDLLDTLQAIGFVTDVQLFASSTETTSRQATFRSVRPPSSWTLYPPRSETAAASG